STVRAEPMSGSELDAAYWMENLRQPVRFAQTIEKLLSNEGEATFLELSAHPILTLAIEENLRTTGRQGQVYSSMQRDKNERGSLLTTVVGLYERNYDLQWEAIFPPDRHRCVPLPTYPWQHERFWIEAESSPQQSSSFHAKRYNSDGHPFLSEPLPLPTSPTSYSWQIQLHTEMASYLQDHRIYDLVVLPGAAYIEIALSAVKQIPEGKGKSWFIENMQFKAMLPITHNMPQQFQLIVKMEDAQRIAFQFFSLVLDGQSQASSWILHTEGTLRELVTASEEEWLFLPQVAKSFSPGSVLRYQSATFTGIRSRCQTPLSKEQYYAKLSASGLNYGARFQGIQQIWRCDGEALAKLQLASLDTTHYAVHPALLDAALQTLLATMPGFTASQEQAQATYLPVAIGDLRLYQQPTAEAWVHVAIQPSEPVQDEQQTQLTGNITVLQPDGTVALEIQGLQVQRLEAASKKQNELEQWFYSKDWELQEVPPAGRNAITASHGTQQTTWLVFSNEQRISSTLKAHIEQQGGHSILVTGGDRYKRLNTHHYQIHPAHPQDYQTLLKDACPLSAPCAGIIYLWSLSIEQPRRGIDAEVPPADLRSLLLQMRNTTLERKAIPLWGGDIYPGDDLSDRDLQRAEAVTCNSTLFLVQALAQASWRHAPRLWLVTQGVEATELSPQVRGTVQSLLWGFGLTILYEHPTLRCTCIDLSPEVSAAELRALCQACQMDEPEAHLVLRGKSRYAARLRRTEIQAPLSNTLFRVDSTYLITGGLGGLGLTVAEWMADQGAGTLILLGRTAPNEQTQVIIEKIRQSGTKVQVQQADVADTAQLASVLASIRTNLPPLRGIFHAAGVLDDVLLVNMQPRHFQRVMEAKVQGAWHLHTLTQQDPLDYFVLFSSAASLLGSPGQGNYAAANAFLDALAFLRQGQELPALSINWGPWSDVGLAISGEKRGKRLAQMGIGGISSSQGVEALGRLLSQEEAPVQVGVLPLNLRQWRQSYPSIAGLPFFANAQEDKTAEQAQQAISMHEQLAEADPTRQQTLLEDFLRQQIAQVLRMVPSKIDRHTSFRILGLESLVAVELRNRLENNLGVALPVTIVWTYPTVQTLAEYLLIKLTSELVEEETTAEIEEAQAQHSDNQQLRESTDASNMEHLTDEEISQLLIEELQDIQDTLLD
ncbi:MAG: SDR family NAD(P)-dependent oxidoreductase, partial [Ktedonobacteraceae bacterium]|nr:SDR family NAD(P)-dependent oxidoreductase [Ktedonobacteraceae bacterium]